MFSGEILVPQDKDGYFFFDRDPAMFPLILNFLRGTMPDVKRMSQREIKALISEAEYYSIDDLVKVLQIAKKQGAWILDPSEKGSNISLTSPMSAFHSHGHDEFRGSSVFGTMPLSTGIHRWKVVVVGLNGDSWFECGVAKKPFIHTDNYAYQQTFGWSSSNQTYPLSSNGLTMKGGGTFEITMNCDTGTLFVTVSAQKYSMSVTENPVYPFFNLHTLNSCMTVSIVES